MAVVIPNMFSLDYSQPHLFALLVVILFAIIVLRYFVVAGAFYSYFYLWRLQSYLSRKINPKEVHKAQFQNEVKWSLITSAIFALTGAVAVVAWQNGHTAVYEDVSKYPLLWLPLSLAVYMFIHETYYYWLHRWMHRPRIYRKVHKVHHDSYITSPWTAFSFHPWEGLIEAIIVPLMLLFIPIHYYVLLLYLTIMTVSSVVNHLDIEIYPQNFHKHRLGKWLIGASHHSLHHKQFRYNYGLYFTFWDKWMKTESPQFEEVFEQQTAEGKMMPAPDH